jgi:hypothetical protein
LLTLLAELRITRLDGAIRNVNVQCLCLQPPPISPKPTMPVSVSSNRFLNAKESMIAGDNSPLVIDHPLHNPVVSVPGAPARDC